MNQITDTIKKFEEALSLPNESRSWFSRRIVQLFESKPKKIQRIHDRMISLIDHLEIKPVYFDSSDKLDLNPLIKAAETLLKDYKVKSRLTERLISLKYRIEKVNGGCDRQGFDQYLFEKISRLADKWKSSQRFFDFKGLTQKQKHRFKLTTTYPDFCRLILKDETLCERFFKWVIKYENNPEPFIEFPKTVDILWQHYLASRIGRFGGGSIQIVKAETKDLTLLFEGKPISILDKKRKVSFRGGLTLSIEEVYKSFRRKQVSVGDLEFFPQGVCNWNVKKLGYFHVASNSYISIDLNKEAWWEQIPAVEVLTTGEACKKYQKPCNGQEWIVTLNSSRHSGELPIFGTHSYLEIAIPKSNGLYQVYYFGKYAKEDLHNIFDFFKVTAQVMSGTVNTPDENIFYKHRQHKSFSVLTSSEKGLGLMKSIKKDLLNVRKDNFVFQLFISNCTVWAWKKAAHHLGNDLVPDLCRMDLMDLKPRGILGKLFALVKACAAWLRRLIFTIIFFILGSWRGRYITKKNGKKNWISLYHNAPWRRGACVHHPSRLFV